MFVLNRKRRTRRLERNGRKKAEMNNRKKAEKKKIGSRD